MTHAILALAVAAVIDSSLDLNYTLPTQESFGCIEAMAPITDLDSTFLYRQYRYAWPRVVQRAGVRGMEGLPWHWTVDRYTQAVYYVTTKDIIGNESCPSNMVQVVGAVSVPVPPRVPSGDGRTQIFDVAGRAVRDTTRSGIYLFKRMGVWWRRVILR